MKYIKTFSIIIFSALLLFCGCSNSVVSESVAPEIEAAVAQAILKENESGYREGECPAEAYIIFGTQTKNNTIYVYLYYSFVNFGFQNSNFVDVSGAQMPAVFEFDAENYELIDVLYPDDGAYYASSIKRMFPKQYESKALNLSDADSENLNNQLNKYAENYLESINRKAKIGRMADFEYVLPTDFGISVDVSNALTGEIGKYDLSSYPYWIGNQEFIENGIRYVYEVDYDQENNI
ncbi:MAG: hypothetical protein K2N83_03470, partial [Eubacterium sp.]|nr:hypothetical protein [Eubacterium sp.]